MLRTLLIVCASYAAICDAFEYKNSARRSKYDYIIVGAGSAGSTLANGLSKDGRFTVLVLEAGGPPPPESEIPILVPMLVTTNMEWNSYSEPQENACLLDPERRCVLNRARVLGGGSSHNHMLMVRGNKEDYNTWESMGAKGWNYDNVLKVYKNVEDYGVPEYVNNGYHGVGGYQTISPIVYPTQIGSSYLEAGQSRGYNIVDYNGASQIGISRVQLSQRDGFRCSTEKAFLRPAASRDNVDILTGAFVLNVTFDDQKKVKSVVFEHQNKTKEIEVSREVILSAGTLASPKILMLSGIGPRQHLEELKIPVLVDLPGVGQNLQDHVAFAITNYLINDSVGIVPSRDVNDYSYKQLFSSKTGPLTSPGFLEVIAFMNTTCPNCPNETPDIVLFIGSYALYLQTNQSDVNSTGVVTMLLHPKSRGELKLRSTNPRDDPIIDPRYLSHPEDVKTSIKGIKEVMKLMERPELQRYNPKPTPEVWQGCENLVLQSDEYIECVIRRYTVSGCHYSSTCTMGDPADNSTVVDPQLRVKGVTGLRVADASIMPLVTSGNLNYPCVMIGQKAADMILSDA